MSDEKPILEYASNRKLWREIDIRFWVMLGAMVTLLLADLSCLAFVSSYG